MPTGAQLNPPTQCCSYCGRQLSRQQIWKRRRCCGEKCRDAVAKKNGRAGVSNGVRSNLAEPMNDAEQRAFDAAIAAGKRQLRKDWDGFIAVRTPVNDSPEAEKKLREVLVGVWAGAGAEYLSEEGDDE